MKEKNHSPLGWYMLGIAALFLAGFFLLVILGAQTYRNTTAAQAGNYRMRSLLAYIHSVVRANDSAGEVSVRTDGPEDGTVLVVGDRSGYASRIYCYEGYLVEDYAEANAPYNPKDAMKIGETAFFSAELGSLRGILRVETDEGGAWVHLRADAEGGEGG